jgi:phosphoribosyl-AMP cyclohydrolase
LNEKLDGVVVVYVYSSTVSVSVSTPEDELTTVGSIRSAAWTNGALSVAHVATTRTMANDCLDVGVIAIECPRDSRHARVAECRDRRKRDVAAAGR